MFLPDFFWMDFKHTYFIHLNYILLCAQYRRTQNKPSPRLGSISNSDLGLYNVANATVACES